MGERQATQPSPEEIIAAFDREAAEAHEHRRQSMERRERAQYRDQPASSDRRSSK